MPIVVWPESTAPEYTPHTAPTLAGAVTIGLDEAVGIGVRPAMFGALVGLGLGVEMADFGVLVGFGVAVDALAGVLVKLGAVVGAVLDVGP